MNRYETIFIADPDLSDEDRGGLFERSKDLIARHDGLIVNFDEWGIKKLAYALKKKTRGYYVYINYCGDGSLVSEMERTFRIDDRVLRYLTVLLDQNANIDKIKEEIASAEVKEEIESAEAKEEIESAEAKPDVVSEEKQDTSTAPKTETADNEETQTASDKKE